MLLLDTWKRSGLPAGDFAALVGLSKHTLYAWQKRFAAQGPAGLMDQPRGQRPGSRLPELTQRTILLLKQAHPTWGCQRISDMLLRGPALPASPGAVARVLSEAGYEVQEEPTKPHPDHVRHFERAKANQLWQTDLFTFMLKRQNRRNGPRRRRDHRQQEHDSLRPAPAARPLRHPHRHARLDVPRHEGVGNEAHRRLDR